VFDPGPSDPVLRSVRISDITDPTGRIPYLTHLTWPGTHRTCMWWSVTMHKLIFFLNIHNAPLPRVRHGLTVFTFLLYPRHKTKQSLKHVRSFTCFIIEVYNSVINMNRWLSRANNFFSMLSIFINEPWKVSILKRQMMDRCSVNSHPRQCCMWS
jgi:hypothetical protein